MPDTPSTPAAGPILHDIDRRREERLLFWAHARVGLLVALIVTFAVHTGAEWRYRAIDENREHATGCLVQGSEARWIYQGRDLSLGEDHDDCWSYLDASVALRHTLQEQAKQAELRVAPSAWTWTNAGVPPIVAEHPVGIYYFAHGAKPTDAYGKKVQKNFTPLQIVSDGGELARVDKDMNVTIAPGGTCEDALRAIARVGFEYAPHAADPSDLAVDRMHGPRFPLTTR